MVLASLLLANALAAQPPGAFLTRVFSTADGLAGTDVRALAPGGAGELLVGTELGVQRFDGGRFTRVQPPEGLGPGGARALVAAGPWVVVVSEQGVWASDGGRAVVLQEGPAAGMHADLETGPDGKIYLANGANVFEVGLDPPALLPLLTEGQLPAGFAPRALAVDEGGLWVGGPDGLWRLEGGALERRGEGTVRALLADGDGLLVGREEGLFREDGSEVLVFPHCFVTGLARLTDGRVVASCGDGARLGRPGGGWEEISEARGLPGPVLLGTLADGDGNLWFGSFGQGLVRLSHLDVRLWSRETGLGGNRAQLLPTADGAVVIATLRGALLVGPDLAPRDLGLQEDDAGLFDVLEDGAGHLFGVTYGNLWRLTPGPPTRLGALPHAAGALVLREGVVHVADSTARMIYPAIGDGPAIPMPEDLIDARLSGGLGGALMGAGRDGLWRLEGQAWTRLGDGPGSCQRGEVLLREGIVWVGCTRGVFRQEGAGWVAELTVADGSLRDLLVQQGEVWASLSDRLVRLAPSRLTIDRASGLPAVGFTSGAGRGLARLGSWLLAASERGVLWVRPEAFESTPSPPVARITGLSAGQTGLDPTHVPHDAGLLRVGLSEDSLSDPDQIAWRFRLDGGAWSEALLDDNLQLAGLAPGAHHLDVAAQRAGGPWSEPPAELDFHIVPAWYQRRGVQLGAALALLLGVGLTVYERTRRLRAELRHLREREELVQTFGRFVTSEVAEEVMSGRLKGEGESREVTVLFADIRGFTPLAARLPPRDVVSLLNAWFSAMVVEIEAEGGSVNKFMGDAVVAVFGAPRALPDHADRALRAATAMARAAERLEVPLKARFGHAVRAGIGVNSGVVVAGPVGSPNRMEYTVYGDPVNVAARVEALTRTLEADVLVTDETARRLAQPFHLVHLGPHALKGVADPVTLWRLEIPRLGDAVLQEQIRKARRKS